MIAFESPIAKRTIWLGAVALLASGCAWGRFTKLKEDTPVVRLDPPDSYSGQFGRNLAIAESNERAELYVAGSAFDTGGLTYSLGMEEDPQPNPTDESQCPSDADCNTIEKPLGVNVSQAGSEERELCFITGYGEIGGRPGLWARCDDNGQIVYRVPADTQAGLAAERDGDNLRSVQLATNRGDEQIVLAATPAQARAWYYEPLSGVPSDIATPGQAGEDFGAAVGVARTDAGHLLAIAAPESAELWLFRIQGGSLERLGCLGGDTGFGRTIAAGDVTGDGDDDFVVADNDRVTIFSGATLAGLDPAAAGGSCMDQALSDDGQVSEGGQAVEIECETGSEISGCNVSRFGAALTVADLDGDGEGEIAVGAPRIAVRGEAKAGAVFVYNAKGERLSVQIVSNAKKDDEFGVSVIGIHQGSGNSRRDILAVGASGSRNAYLLYCAGGSDGNGSPRCN